MATKKPSTSTKASKTQIAEPTDSPIYDVTIVGAGPAGLVTAIAFGKAGFKTALIAPGIDVHDGRSTALLADSAEFLKSLDVWDAIHEASSELIRMRLIDDTGRLIRAPEVTFDAAELDLEAFGYNVLNVDLNRILEARLKDISEITFIEDKGQSYRFFDTCAEVSTEKNALVRTRLLIAADGRNSAIRRAADIDIRKWSYPQVAVVGNLDHEQPHRDTSTEFHTPTGPFTLVPMAGNRSSLVCVESPQTADYLVSMRDEELEKELERRAYSVLGKFKLASKFQAFPLSGMTATSVCAQRVALIGEAAHVFPPIGAQGLNLGLRDVADLVSIVSQARDEAKDIGSAEVLEAYNRKRLPDIKSRTTAVDALNRSLLTDFLPVQIIRSTGLYLADRIPVLRKFLMREGIAPGLSKSMSGGLPKRQFRLPSLRLRSSAR